jgi:multiple sugar transport system substrate-binding protein
MTNILRKTLLAGLALSAFSSAAMAGEVTLLFWPGPESEAMQKVLDAYNAGPGQADGVTVKQLLFSRQGYFEKERLHLRFREYHAKILMTVFSDCRKSGVF